MSKPILIYGKFINLLALFILVSGCSLNKYIPEDKILLKKAKIRHAPSKYIDDLRLLVKQRPRNRGIFFSEPYHYVYFKLDKGKQTAFRRAMKSGFGEKPIFLDTSLMYQSVRQIHEYLKNKGYINNIVIPVLKTKNKKARLVYQVHIGKPFYINSVNYRIFDDHISRVLNPPENSLLSKDIVFSIDILLKERDRIAHVLNNNGYFKFSKSYVYIDVDTTLVKDRLVDINVIIRNPTDTTLHNIYKIKKLSVDPLYNVNDTLKNSAIKRGNIIFTKRPKNLHLKVLANRIKIKSDDIYRVDDVRKTSVDVSELQIFKFIDVNFEEIESPTPDTLYLNCLIRLTPQKKQEINPEIELNTTDENRQITQTSNQYYGMAGNISYRNKNIFKNAVQWSTTFGGSFDIEANSIATEKLLGNYQLGLNTSLLFPTAFLPRPIKKIFSSQSAKTALNSSYFYESNQDFRRSTVNLSYVYQFLNKWNRNFVTPFEVSLVQTQLNDNFKAQLESIKDPFLSNAFETHLLTFARYALVYNNKGLRESQYWRVMFSLEAAGTILRFLNVIGGIHNDSTKNKNLTIGGLNYFQYFKNDLDVSYNYNITSKTSIVYRICTGIGIPYGNSDILPFEKRYYIGGVNSIRAWPIRELGPGTYSDTSNSTYTFDRSGELKIETNLEYRFDIFYFPQANIHTRGAIFLDAGNIWNLTSDTIRRGGAFNAGDFVSELALGGGFGFRFDFTYFILRIDLGTKMRDPSMDKQNRWVITNIDQKKWIWNNSRINLGIGYPF